MKQSSRTLFYHSPQFTRSVGLSPDAGLQRLQAGAGGHPINKLDTRCGYRYRRRRVGYGERERERKRERYCAAVHLTTVAEPPEVTGSPDARRTPHPSHMRLRPCFRHRWRAAACRTAMRPSESSGAGDGQRDRALLGRHFATRRTPTDSSRRRSLPRRWGRRGGDGGFVEREESVRKRGCRTAAAQGRPDRQREKRRRRRSRWRCDRLLSARPTLYYSCLSRARGLQIRRKRKSPVWRAPPPFPGISNSEF